MSNSKSSGRAFLRAANDNTVTERVVQVDIPSDFPVTEIELEIVETYLSAIISGLAMGTASSPANDNMPEGEREG